MLPILVATASAPAALEQLASTAPESRRVDWVEARIDLFPADDHERASRSIDALAASGTPVLATLRWTKEGGSAPSDDEARVARYVQLLPHVHAIDVELASAHAETLVRAAHAAGKKVVLSAHDFTSTPDDETLRGLVARGLALGADIVKIAAMTPGPEVYGRLVALLDRAPRGKLAVLGMGPYGVALRVFLPAAGSALAYAYLDTPAAPGQLSAHELGTLLERLVPGYVPGACHRIVG